MEVCSLGMLALDDFEFTKSQARLTGAHHLSKVLGGAGTYAVLGARLFRRGTNAKKVGWVVHVGSDFPAPVRDTIESWGCSTRFIPTPDRRTTRASNVYNERENREFKFLTEKVRVDETMLDEAQLESKVFHMICTPERCINLVKGICHKRKPKNMAFESDQGRGQSTNRPIFVWEPMEGSCQGENLDSFLEAMNYIDVFSPNTEEFAKLLGRNTDTLSPQELEANCNHLLYAGFEDKPCAVVVRLGTRGAYVAQRLRHSHFPAYYQPSGTTTITLPSENRIVDVTGGGNTFLGAFCVGLVDLARDSQLTEFESAAMLGNVAASFAIEQVGMPKLSVGKDGTETWNGDRPADRLLKYETRLQPLLYGPVSRPETR